MTFQNPFVRHLYWAISSDDLANIEGVCSLPRPENSQLLTWCREIDTKPELFESFLEENEHRLLGSYFEVIWQFFCRYFPEWQCLGSRIQIPAKGPTLGELDMICVPPDGLARHVELAVKFYLRHPNQSGDQPSHWLGPRIKDRLDLKLNKLSEKQFRIIEQPITQATLEAQGLPVAPSPCSVVKGYLFDPLDASTTKWPKEVGKPSHCGQWLPAQDIHKIAYRSKHWCIIDKHQWLGPYEQDDDEVTYSSESLIAKVHNHFLQPNYALMLIAVSAQSNGWYEDERYMVVMNGWPQI